MQKRFKVGVVFGTRPEAIKLAPVIFAMRSRPGDFEPVLIATSQHRQMLEQVLRVFGIQPDIDLDLMQTNQSLGGISARALHALDSVLPELDLDCLMVQGDTTTVFTAALSAFYHRIPVAHVEAGLRSRDIRNPYPEEVNRRLASVLTAIHFAPTTTGRQNLLAEGISEQDVVVTGNTVIDAVQYLQESGALPDAIPVDVPDGARVLLVTSHRRESWGADLHDICDAVTELVAAFSDVHVVYPVHLNPNVGDTVRERLGGMERVHLTPPLDYFQFLGILRRCYLVLTDSGGVQEEAPSFRKPVLVLRKVTERPEAAMMGLARVIGTSRRTVVQEASRLLEDPLAYRAMTSDKNPFGDGKAAHRITEALSRWARGEQPLLEETKEFDSAVAYDSLAA